MSKLFEMKEDSVIGLDVVEPLHCEYPKCKGILIWWGAKFLKFPLNKEKTKYGHACDIIMICPECGLLHIFGHPIHEIHWKQYKNSGDGITHRADGSTLYQIGNNDG